MHKANIVYPNLYYGGVYSLAMIIFYNLINSKKDWMCSRVFLDKGKIDSKFIGFTISYELDYQNVIDMLQKNKIPLDKNREEIIFAGGPCIISNPETLSDFIDFFILGEADETMMKVLEVYEVEQNKERFLALIQDIPGVYVPGMTKDKCYTFVKNLDKIPYPLYQPLPKDMTKDFVFGKSFILETERGCPYQCKFCSVGVFYKGIRMRSLDNLKKIIDAGVKLNKRDKIVIYSPSFVHKDRKKILQYILSKGLKFSVPSLKAETIDEELIELVAKGGQKSLTLAPECNESLRKKLNKNVADKAFFNVVKLANKHKIKSLKYYFLIGIPDQTDIDLKETVELIKDLKNKFKGKTYISINPLVGKPKTQFAGIGFDRKNVRRQGNFLKKELGKIGVKVKLSGVGTSEKEYKLAYTNEFKPHLLQ